MNQFYLYQIKCFQSRKKRKLILNGVIMAWAMLLILFTSGFLYAQSSVTGQVVSSEDNVPIPGVSVLIKGTTTGTVTDINGEYRMPVEDLQVTLVFSSIGFVTEEIQINNRTGINVSLTADIKQLTEVVVIGYGTVKKSNVTGSIVSVKPEELRQIPSTNVMESLQGRLPGVDITRSSGAAGAGINVLVRGNRSLTASNNPLFIVDGIQYENIQDLNPNDIASMEVLKDAASTAVYGSRGANGVIIITTKQGKAGQTRISFNSYAGVSQPVNYPEVFNPQEFIRFNRVANGVDANDASQDNAIFADPYMQERIAANGGADYPSLLLRNGSQQDYSLGIASGTDKSNFYVSLNYFNEKGVLRMDELNRYSIRANIDHALSKRIRIGSQNQITYYDQDVRRDPLDLAYKINPLLEPYDENGEFIDRPNGGKDINPLVDEQPGNFANQIKTNRIFTSAYFNYNIIDNLNFRSNMGITFDNRRQGIYRGSNSIDRNGAASEAVYGKHNRTQLNWENILTYNKEFGAHSLGLTGVQSYLTIQSDSLIGKGENQVLSSNLFYGIQNSSQAIAVNTGYEESTLLSYTGRVQYGYKDKYLLMLTGRADGASQLSPHKRWAFFPSVSAAWRIIEEDFLKGAGVFSDLKLRLSYGIAGNYSVDPYSTQTNLRRIPFGFGDVAAGGFIYGDRLGNPDLGWEITSTYNIGLDFGILGNRVTGTIDAYHATTEDLLLERALPLSSGVARIIENVGSTQNKGIEIGLNAVAINSGSLRWNVGVNWFANQEKILSLATGGNDEVNRWFIGHPTNAHFDFEKIGIWQTDQSDEAATYNQNPGDIRVKDQDGNGVIDQSDRIVLGSNVPQWSGNFTSDLKFKNFDLNLQLFARVGQMINWSFAGRYDPTGIENSLKHDYWTPDNPTNAYPQPDKSTSRDNTLYVNTLRYRDGSFAKLRGITLGYTLPKSVTQRVGVENLRFYVTGRNVFTWSGFENYDPERGGAFTSPIPRLFVGGINLDF